MSARVLAGALAALLVLCVSPAPAEVVQKGGLRIALSGSLAPRALPRSGLAPVAVSLGGEIAAPGGARLPQLRTLAIEINRHGRLDTAGLPVCPKQRIAIATSSRALAGCRRALVGSGRFDADVVLRGQEPYPTSGRLLIFNGRERGRPALLGHVFAQRPFATSFVIVFRVSHRPRGRYGTVVGAALPEALGDWGHVTGIAMRLSRRYLHGNRRHSYISAGCPAPKGFSRALFTLARMSFRFAGGTALSGTVSGSCRVRG